MKFFKFISIVAAVIAVSESSPSIAIIALSVFLFGFTGTATGVLHANPASTVDAIAKYAGAHSKQIISQILNGMEIAKDLKVYQNVDGHGLLLPKMIVNKGMRPLNTRVHKNAEPGRNFTGRKLEVNGCMKIIEIIPEDLRKSFLDRDPNALDPKARDIPYAQWVWEQEGKKASSEINDEAYFNEFHADAAVWSASSTYTAGNHVNFKEDIYRANATTTAGESPESAPAKWDNVNGKVMFDGIGTIIAKEITAGKLTNVINTGSISDSNAVDKLESMYRDMETPHKNAGGVLYTSIDTFEKYVIAERAKYGPVATPTMGNGKKYLYMTNNKWEVRGCSWIPGSRVMATQKDNLAMGTYRLGDLNTISEPVRHLHGYDSIIKFLLGFQISDLETLYVNDQA